MKVDIPTNKNLYFRNLKDSIAAKLIKVSGIFIIGIVLMIMFILLYVALPLFENSNIEFFNLYDSAAKDIKAKEQNNKILYQEIDELNQLLLNFKEKQQVEIIKLKSNQSIDSIVAEKQIINLQDYFPSLAEDEKVISVRKVNNDLQLLVMQTNLNNYYLLQIRYKVDYKNDVSLSKVVINTPYGDSSLPWIKSAKDLQINAYFIAANESNLYIVYQKEQEIVIKLIEHEYDDELNIFTINNEDITENKIAYQNPIDTLYIDELRLTLIVLEKEAGSLAVFNIKDLENIRQIQYLKLQDKVNASSMLLGGRSLMIATKDGMLSQWFGVKDDENNSKLTKVREFNNLGQIKIIKPFNNNKSVALLNNQGHFKIIHTTAERLVLDRKFKVADNIAIDPRGYFVYFTQTNQDSTQIRQYKLDSEHPEVSFGNMWNKIWYEGYVEPSYTWQSSAATNDFEPKFSLVPLTFGTLKAAFYSMLLAVPISILAAIYVSFYVTPRIRAYLKPTIETIEALPTVILGFLAGLWLAPIIENNILVFFNAILLLPLGIFGFALLWEKYGKQYNKNITVANIFILLIFVILILIIFIYQISNIIEYLLFDNNFREWLNYVGYDYNQRNSLIIGIAMGFALIPTIFSVAEDSITAVPASIINGSYALGANSWQTIVGVVLPTAASGIFAAIMLGFGRGVGETMIVLMASGNTPIIDINIFEGMRTLSANIAIEMSEAEVDSSHYRILFMSGLVLFLFTLFFNSISEFIRVRMRKKYSNL